MFRFFLSTSDKWIHYLVHSNCLQFVLTHSLWKSKNSFSTVFCSRTLSNENKFKTSVSNDLYISNWNLAYDCPKDVRQNVNSFDIGCIRLTSISQFYNCNICKLINIIGLYWYFINNQQKHRYQMLLMNFIG